MEVLHWISSSFIKQAEPGVVQPITISSLAQTCLNRVISMPFTNTSNWFSLSSKNITRKDYLELPAAEMAKQPKGIELITSHDFRNLRREQKTAILVYVDEKHPEWFNDTTISALSEDDLSLLPLKSLLYYSKHYTGTQGKDYLNGCILKTFLAFVKEYIPRVLYEEELAIIHDLVEQKIFTYATSHDELWRINATIWKAVETYAPYGLRNVNKDELTIQKTIGYAVLAMPINNLNNIILMFEIVDSEFMREVIQTLSERIFELPRYASLHFQNIIEFLIKAYAQFNMECPSLLIKMKDPHNPSQLERFNSKIISSGIVEHDWEFYKDKVESPKELYLLLIDEMQKILIQWDKNPNVLDKCREISPEVEIYLDQAIEILREIACIRESSYDSFFQQLLRVAEVRRHIPMFYNNWRTGFRKIEQQKVIKYINELVFEDSPMQVLPQEMHKLTHLYKISLRNTGLIKFEIPDTVRFALLEHLDLSNNLLKEIPQSFFYSTALKTLNCAHNQITVIPKDIIKLTSLVSFSINSNQITVLPNLNDLNRLIIIKAEDNLISEVEGPLSGLKSLVELRLSGNRLRNLPDLNRLNNLSELNLSDNYFKDFTAKLPSSLNRIVLSSNLLTTYPYTTSHVRQVNLSNNTIALDGQIKKITTVVLNLMNNHLYELNQELPPYLEFLCLNDNHLTEVPSVLKRYVPRNGIEVHLQRNFIVDCNLELEPNSRKAFVLDDQKQVQKL